MTMPENTRLLRTGELPPIGTRVYVPENTTAFVGNRPVPGWRTILATDDSDSTVAVKSETGNASWVLSHNLLVEDEAPEPALATVRHETVVTLAAPATAFQISRALYLIPLGWFTTVDTYADRIEIRAHHEEPRG